MGGAECITEHGRRLAELRLRVGAEEGRESSEHTAIKESSRDGASLASRTRRQRDRSDG